MIPEQAIIIPVTGFLILVTHPVFFEKYRYFKEQFFLYKLMELGVIAYSLALILMLIIQKFFELLVQNFYPKGALLDMFSTITAIENGSGHSLFWSISTSTLPIALCWMWSRIALFLFIKSNTYWERKTTNPITKLLLCYSLSKECSMSHLILDSLIDQTPLLFVLKEDTRHYIGLPVMIEIRSYSAETPFKDIAIFPLFVSDEKLKFLDNTDNLIKKFGLSIKEEQIFIPYKSIDRVSVLSI